MSQSLEKSTVIVCTVNQNEAISRGYNATEKAILEIDVSVLSQERRDMIAAFWNSASGFFGLTIQEPTEAGLIEAIDRHLAGLKSGKIQVTRASGYETRYAKVIVNEKGASHE